MDSRELATFEDSGWRSVTLGPNVLRTETAAIVAASVVSTWWFDSGNATFIESSRAT